MIYPLKFKETTKEVEFFKEVLQLYHEARSYLLSFSWCKEIKNCELYINLGKPLCVFLFEIENLSSPDDRFLWTIVGDIPPMFLDIYGARTTIQALEDYVTLAADWINAVRQGKSVADCYPFNIDSTIEMANLLDLKISFIQNQVIPNVDNIPVILK